MHVWDEDEHGNWHLTASWKAHSGSVWKVTWAHPEFGQVLATCSFDRTAAVWEEIVGEGSGPGERGMRHWVRRTNLVDSRKSVTDVKFAPKTLGLLLATCSEDGVIRIYEAPDVMNLSQWTLQHDISCKLQCSCLSWNPSLSRLHPPMIAVGSDDSNPSSGGKVFIYEYSESSRRWAKTETLTIVDPVHDIAFAPNLGRSFHTLAIATKDVRIITLKPLIESVQSGAPRFEITTAAQFFDHDFTVWRVCWNIMGTILASSGDDGCVRLWKDNYINNWKCVAVLKGDGTSAQSAETPTAATPPNHSTGTQQTPSTTRAVTVATVTAEKPTVTVMCINKWQAPITKGRFSKSVWLGNPSEATPPPPPILECPKTKK
ncbi:nuclear pore complex protein Nup44A isoform X2 [Augochlora pura]